MKYMMSSILAVVLAALMFVMPVAASTGSEMPYASLVREGKEAVYDLSLEWIGHEAIGEEANQAIGSFLEGIEVSGHSGTDASGAKYGSFDFAMGGMSVLPVEWFSTENSLFVNAPAVGGVIGITEEDLPGAVEIISAAISEFVTVNASTTAGAIPFGADELATIVSDALLGNPMDMQGLEDLYPQEMLEQNMAMMQALVEAGTEAGIAFGEWAEALVPEELDEPVDSRFDVKASMATVYKVGKEDILALMEAVMPLLAENDALIEAIYDYTNAQAALTGAPMDVTQEEFKQIVAEMMESMMLEASTNMSEDEYFQFIQSMDAEGNLALIQALYTSEATPDEPTQMYAYLEWIPGTPNLYGYLGDDNNGQEFTCTFDAPNEEGDMRFEVAFGEIFDGEPDHMTTVAIEVDQAQEGAVYARTVALSYAVEGGYSELRGIMALTFHEEDTLIDEGHATTQKTLTLTMSVEDETFDLLKAEFSGEVGGEPVGPKFDPETVEGTTYRPGQMTLDEFNEWSSGVLLPSIMQTSMLIMSALPPEMLASF